MADTRREFVKKALYVAPAIVTASVIPSLASAGSVKDGDVRMRPRRDGRRQNHDHQHHRPRRHRDDD